MHKQMGRCCKILNNMDNDNGRIRHGKFYTERSNFYARLHCAQLVVLPLDQGFSLNFCLSNQARVISYGQLVR